MTEIKPINDPRRAISGDHCAGVIGKLATRVLAARMRGTRLTDVETWRAMECKGHFQRTQARIHRIRRLHCITTTVLLLGMMVALITAPTVGAQEALPEYQVKAAYLFNFLKFVEWPSDAFPDSLAPIVIGIVGDDPFGSALPEVVMGKTVQGRDLVIRRYHPGENVRGASTLFISASERKRLTPILASLHGSSVLTVADMDGFLDDGGMIQFQSENDRVRFAINVDAASRARLKMSSKLLSLASVVGRTAREGGS